MKECSKPFLIVCAFIKGIQTAIIREREYNNLTKDLNRINKEFSQSKKGVYHVFVPINPEIVLIHQTTPFSYVQAETLYNIAKAEGLPLDVLVERAIKSGWQGFTASGIRKLIYK
jgi:hypothetical protein